MPYATAKDGTQLYYKDWGKGDPVVLLHGWPLTGDTFDDAAVALAEAGKRCIIPDRRGFGRSDQPWDGYDYDTFADDVAAILEDAGITEPVALVGFSMGGGEVARFLTKQGANRVSKAVLIGSVVPYMLQTDDNPNGVPQATFDEMTAGMKKDRAHFFTGFFKDFYGVGALSLAGQRRGADEQLAPGDDGRPAPDPRRGAGLRDHRLPPRPRRASPCRRWSSTAPRTRPCRSTPPRARSAKAVPGAQLIEYDGSAHGLFATDKDRLIDDLLTFLGGTGADQRSAIPLSQTA